MHYRRFGRTELHLSVFSLGTMRCLASAEVAAATIRRAIALGVNHLETAQGYGASEVFVGQALHAGVGVPRSQLILTTKISPLPTAAAMATAIQTSLQRLQVDYLDCLAIHGINTAQHHEWIQAPQGCMAAVRAAVERGQIRHVGFSTHGDRALIDAVMHTGQFEFVNLHYTLLFQRHAPLLDVAAALDMGVFIISPADKGGQLYTPPARLQALCQPQSPLELNYRFLLSDRRITTLSVGAACPEELEEPLRYGNQTDPLSPAEHHRLAELEQAQAEALGRDRCQQCYACLPCPEAIHIPEVLRLRNLAIAYDMEAFGQYRYGMFENAGHWFPGRKGNRCTDCGDCLPRCPSQLDIPTLLRDTHHRLQGRERRRLWGD